MATGFGLGGWAHQPGVWAVLNRPASPDARPRGMGWPGGRYSSAGVAKGAGRPCAKGVAAAASRVPTGVARWCGKGGGQRVRAGPLVRSPALRCRCTKRRLSQGQLNKKFCRVVPVTLPLRSSLVPLRV